MVFQSSNSTQRSGRPFGLSVVLHVLAVLGLVLLGRVAEEPVKLGKNYSSVTILAPAREALDEVKLIISAPKKQARAPTLASVKPPRPRPLPERKALAANQPKVPLEPPAPAPLLPRALDIPMTPPQALPEPELKTGVLASAAPGETKDKAIRTVRAAGFGQARVSESPKSDLSFSVGSASFDRASPAANDGARWRKARYERPAEEGSGFGTVSAARPQLPTAGASARRAAGAAFAAVTAASGGSGPPASTQQAGFEEVVYTDDPQGSPRVHKALHSSKVVRVLEKPKPQYTREAQIEGVVSLQILFAKTGEIEVLRVVKGLGHGLDENAIQAARHILFEPAERNGQPVDLVATIQIRFQLAY